MLPKAEVSRIARFTRNGPLNGLQTPQGELLNNFVSGSVGGFVGTVLNTPYVKSYSRLCAAVLNSIARFDVSCRLFV